MSISSSAATRPDPVDEGRRSILGNFKSVVVGQLVSALSMWFALVVLAKLSDPDTVGLYALALAICTPIAETAKMGLREIRSSDTIGAYRFGDYLGLRLFATCVALVLMVSGAVLQAKSAVILWVIILYALTRCLEMVSDIIYALFQAHERMDLIGWSLCLRGPLSLVFISLSYWLSRSLVIAMLGQLLAHVLVLFLYDVPMGRRRGELRASDAFRPIWEGHTLRGLALQATPLVIASLLVTIALYLPQLVVEHTMGLSALGYFAALSALAMSPSRFVQSLGTAASVRLAQSYASGELPAFVRLLGLISLGVAILGASGFVLSIVFGKAILSLVYAADYAEYAELLTWLVAAGCLRFVADVLGAGMIASRRFWWLTLQYGAVASIAVISCFTFIPWLGLVGAGIAVLLIFFSQFVVILLGIICSVRLAGQ